MASAKVVAGRNQVVAALMVSSLLVIGAIWFWNFVSPDRLLERSYSRVAPHGTLYLDDMGPDSRPAIRVTPASAPLPPTAPTLLIDGIAVESGILTEPVAVGAHLRLAPGAANSRAVEVTGVADLDAPVVGLPGVRLQMVTARPVGHGARGRDTIQLIFAIRDAEPAKVAPVPTATAGRVL